MKNDTNVNLPNMPKPCADCPFRKDTLKGWLGKERMREILSFPSFVCHKKKQLQCAGHMLINEDKNHFVRTAKLLGIKLKLKGRELIFDTKDACVKHHEK